MVMWLSGLHIPEAYLTAHVQMACRLYTWPLDRSTQFTRVTKFVDPDEVEERPITVSSTIVYLTILLLCSFISS